MVERQPGGKHQRPAALHVSDHIRQISHRELLGGRGNQHRILLHIQRLQVGQPDAVHLAEHAEIEIGVEIRSLKEAQFGIVHNRNHAVGRVHPGFCQNRRQHIQIETRRLRGGPAHLGNPDRLFADAVLPHQRAQAGKVGEHHLRHSPPVVRMDVHHIETVSGPRLQRGFDERQRHSRRAAVQHGDFRVDRLDLPVGAFEQLGIVFAAGGIVPEGGGVLFVPDLPVTQQRITVHKVAHIAAPQIEVFPRRSRPRHVIVEDRQHVDLLFFRQLNHPVEVAVIPAALLRLRIFPVEIGADPVDARLVHFLKSLRRELPLAAAHMRTDSIRVLNHRRSGGQRQPRGRSRQTTPRFFHLLFSL